MACSIQVVCLNSGSASEVVSEDGFVRGENVNNECISIMNLPRMIRAETIHQTLSKAYD